MEEQKQLRLRANIDSTVRGARTFSATAEGVNIDARRSASGTRCASGRDGAEMQALRSRGEEVSESPEAYDEGMATDLARDAYTQAKIDAGIMAVCPTCDDGEYVEHLACTEIRHLGKPCRIYLCEHEHHVSVRVEAK